MNNYLVLARRTRPQSLDALVGQDAIKNALKSMLETHKVPHAFLFSGTRGTGKTSAARIFAKSLNCENGATSTPCQTCRHCTQITSCSHEDVFEIDAASHTGVDNIRNLKESARFFPVSARYKIFIIDEAHMLSSGAFNALLKTLEEPPAQVVFILATTELNKVPITIRSRCVTFAFKKIDHLVIFNHLKHLLQTENIPFEEDAITLIAREAQGSLRDSLSLLEQALSLRTDDKLTYLHTKESLGLQNNELGFLLFSAICRNQQIEALEILNNADSSALDLSLVMQSAANYFKYAMILKSNPSQKFTKWNDLLKSESFLITQASDQLNFAAISEIFKLLSLSVKDLQRATDALSWAEVVVIDALNRADWLSASDMLIALQSQQRDVSIPSDKVKGIQNSPPKTSLPTSEVPKSSTISQPNLDVDIDLYKKLITEAKKRSPTLGARLSFVQLERFHQNEIKFADTPENATYLAFDSSDEACFQEILQEMGLAHLLKKQKVESQKFVSLNAIEENERKAAFSLKEKEILSRDSVKNLMMLSKEIKLTPIEK